MAGGLGAKHKNLEGFEHLRGCLSLRHGMKAGMDAKQHAGAGLEWGYVSRALGCSMNEYTDAALKEFEHALPKQMLHAPSKPERPEHGARAQCIEDDMPRKLTKGEAKRAQKVAGKLLPLARAAGRAAQIGRAHV